MSLAVKPLHLCLFLLIVLVWGVNFAVVKIGLAEFPPILFIALRFMLVAAILVPFAKRPTGNWLQVIGVSFTLGLLHFSLMFSGIKYVDASTAVIAVQLQVPFAALLASIVFKDKLGWRRGLGMAVAFAGVVVIAGEPGLQGNYFSLFLIIAAACVWAVTNIQVKLLRGVDGMSLNAWVALLAVPQLLLASWLLEEGQIAAIAAAPLSGYLAILYNSLGVVIFGYGCWYWLLKRYNVNDVMSFTLIIPVFGVISGIVMLGETLSLVFVIGAVLTLIGVGIIVLRRPDAADPKAERV
ncbi:MAG: EamA family transporter [Rhodovibrionaceae bacterium]